MWSRRRFIRGGLSGAGSISIMMMAGCVFDSGDGDSSQTPGEDDPDPVVVDSSVPNPVVISTTREKESDTYTATIENRGGTGVVGVDFLWADGEMVDGKPTETFDTDSVEEKTVEMSSGETKTVSVSPGEKPKSEYGYWFSTIPRSVYVTVRNDGASGDVTISLTKLSDGGEDTIASKTVSLQSNSTTDVELMIDSGVVDSETPSLRIDFSVP